MARSTPFLTVTDQHLVTPPPKLVDQWLEGADSNNENVSEGLALRAAQWGYEQRGAELTESGEPITKPPVLADGKTSKSLVSAWLLLA